MKIYNKFVFAGLWLCLVVSCTDTWDEHYSIPERVEGSLWEAICQDPELSNFKEVLEAVDYKNTLSSSQVFTVFAPTNSYFGTKQRDSVISLYNEEKSKGVKPIRNMAIKEFVNNHVALYNYSISSTTQDSIVMKNMKYLSLTSQSLDGVNLKRKNVQASNGVLFTLEGMATYRPNIYEYLGRDADLDSIATYIYMYSIDEFQPSLSVPGDIVDGKTQYLDSVTKMSNKLLSTWGLSAELNDEDSVYWMLAPTNEVWKEKLAEYQPYFYYDKKVKARDSLMFNGPRWGIVLGTAFSRTINPDLAFQDSAMSTNSYPFAYREMYWGNYKYKYYQYDRPFDEGGAFYGAVPVECSNGRVLKTSQWNVSKYDTFMRDIVMEAEWPSSIDSIGGWPEKNKHSYVGRTVKSTNPFYNEVSSHMFSELSPSGSNYPDMVMNLRGVMSNVPYDIYVVTVPATAYDENAGEEDMQPTKVRAQVFYTDADGKDTDAKDNPLSFARTSDFDTNPNKVDSILIGTYTFPAASWGLNEVKMKIKLEAHVTNATAKKGYTKVLRLDCVLLRPHCEEN